MAVLIDLTVATLLVYLNRFGKGIRQNRFNLLELKTFSYCLWFRNMISQATFR